MNRKLQNNWIHLDLPIQSTNPKMNGTFQPKLPAKRTCLPKSPKSKRPKLDFTAGNVNISIFNTNKNFSSSEKQTLSVKSSEIPKRKTEGPIQEWDEDFSGAMLEEACLIADLSQVMVNDNEKKTAKPFQKNNSNEENQLPKSYLRSADHIPKHLLQQSEIFTDGNEEEVVKNNNSLTRSNFCEQTTLQKSNMRLEECTPNDLKHEVERLKLENERLQEHFKTKEGEVLILRSQLKQIQDTKLTDSLNHAIALEDLKHKFQDQILCTEKNLESIQTKLEFKDLEVTKLTERCKQLESNTSKIKFVEPHAVRKNKKICFNLSQSISSTQKPKTDQTLDKRIGKQVYTLRESTDGLLFRNMICPEFFELGEEPNIIKFYPNSKKNSCHVSRLDFDKREKYMWKDLPIQKVFIKDTYANVSFLLLCENFQSSVCKNIVEEIITKCGAILEYQRDLLQFLVNIQNTNLDFDDPDQLLLNNEDAMSLVGIKDLLSIKKLNKDECGCEGRRTLGLILALIRVSKFVLNIVLQDLYLFKNLHSIVKLIGDLRRPVRYAGLLLGVIFIFREILKEKENYSPSMLHQVIEEIIFSRPKLNVLRELIILLQVGAQNKEITNSLCRDCSMHSCSLFMNSKLQQAMFFTKDACPLQVFFTHLMGLLCLPSSAPLRFEITKQILKWLNYNSDNAAADKNNWLHTSSGKLCFDLDECFAYMLTLCVRDYKGVRIDCIQTKSDCSVIGSGIIMLKQNMERNPVLFSNKGYNLLFALSLYQLRFCKQFESFHKDCIEFITSVLENNREKEIMEEREKYNQKKISLLNEDILTESLSLKSDNIYN